MIHVAGSHVLLQATLLILQACVIWNGCLAQMSVFGINYWRPLWGGTARSLAAFGSGRPGDRCYYGWVHRHIVDPTPISLRLRVGVSALKLGRSGFLTLQI